MGQAKKRGTYDERKANAIADNELAVKILREQEQVWWDSLTEDEKANVRLNRAKQAKKLAELGMMSAAVHAAGGIHMPSGEINPLAGAALSNSLKNAEWEKFGDPSLND